LKNKFHGLNPGDESPIGMCKIVCNIPALDRPVTAATQTTCTETGLCTVGAMPTRGPGHLGLHKVCPWLIIRTGLIQSRTH